MTISTQDIRAKLTESEYETLEELDEIKDADDTWEDFLDEGDDLDEGIHEIADNRVSCYTYDRIKWYEDNWQHTDQGEDAIASGAKNITDALGQMWYEHERESVASDVEEIRKAVADLNQEEEDKEEEEDKPNEVAD